MFYNNESNYFTREEFLEIRKEIDNVFKDTELDKFFTWTKSTFGNSKQSDFVFTLKVKPITYSLITTADPAEKIDLFILLFTSIKDYILYNKRNFVFLKFREHSECLFTFEFQPKQLKIKSDLRR